jgi:DNA mismatch endonuclease (patch repair protein)
LVFPRLRKIIIVHGCFWHMHTCGRCRIPTSRQDYWIAKLQRNADRDKRTVRTLRRAGWKVLVVWECQTNTERTTRLKAKIATFLSDQRLPSPKTPRRLRPLSK